MQQETLTKKQTPREEKVVNIDLRMHTIIILVGPSGCGKTYFTENKLIPSLKSQGDVTIHRVGSDDIRRELLGDDTLSKSDLRMMHASVPAFDVLKSKVDALTSYPVNSHFVIVDSTALKKDFRDEIKEIAYKNNYNTAVINFDYKNRGDYEKFINDESEENKRTTHRQVEYMRKNVMSELTKKHFRDIYKIKSHDLSKVDVSIINYDRHLECKLPKGEYTIIGDIHGCYDEFIRLIEKNGFTIENGKITGHDRCEKIVLVGDLVDKGYDVRGVVEFVYNNMEWFLMVKGNHENFVYKYLHFLEEEDDREAARKSGEPYQTKSGIKTKDLPPQEIIDTYFDSIELFRKDDKLKQKFYTIVDSMKPYLEGEHFIVTHAPCDQKYLGKLGKNSERNQMTVVYPKSAEFDIKADYLYAKYKFFSYFRKQSSRSYPTHVFGHVSTDRLGIKSNKINVDTGCVSGGKLTSVVVNVWGRPFIKEVSAEYNDKVENKELHDFFYVPPPKVNLDDLEGKERGRIYYASEAGVNFISGTVCPADKIMSKDENKDIVIEDSELESLDQAINYFRRAGVDKLVAQPKYMGSRANVYLFADPEKNFTTSRGGFVIKPDKIDLTDVYKPLYDVPFIKEAFEKNNTELLILDAELVPWSVLGKGLIEKTFVTVDKALNSEVDFLKKTGFEKEFNKIFKGSYADDDYENVQHKTSKKKLENMFGSSKANTYRSIRDYEREFPSLDALGDLAKVYSRQVELYGSDGEPSFKPFSILKQVFKDGTEKLFFNSTNEEVYEAVNDDDFIVIDITSEDDIDKLKKFYENTTVVEEMEGIMLKPHKVYIEGVAPAVKVRNPRYLTIVYGPDYQMPRKLTKLIDRKRTFKKMEISVKEWEIGKRLLEIPFNKIDKENKSYVQAYAEMILEENKEQELDPRL